MSTKATAYFTLVQDVTQTIELATNDVGSSLTFADGVLQSLRQKYPSATITFKGVEVEYG